MMIIDPFRSGVQGPATLTFIQTTSPVSTGATATVLGIPIGAEAPGRKVIVSAHWVYNTAGPVATPIAFSANGNVGSISVVSGIGSHSAPVRTRCAAAIADAPTDTTVDITMNFDNAAGTVVFGVYVATNISSNSTVGTASGTGTDNAGITVNCPVQAEGVLVAAGSFFSFPVAYTGVTKRYEFNPNYSGGGDTTPTSTTASISATDSVSSLSNTSLLVAASFR